MTTSAAPSQSSHEPSVSSSPRSVSSTPRSSSSNKRIRRQCSASDCTKVDAGGGFCVSHGGGKKCSFPGCHKGYQTGGFCRQHGGGSRCQVDGCGKVDAGKGLCRAHGGGKRCQVANCSKADVGGGFCTAHGGGKRCSVAGCTKIDQGGGKCRAHGGARRCRHEDCGQPARGSSGLCSEHGGAQICATHNCRRLVKIEDTKYCSGCTKDQLKMESDNSTSNMHDDTIPFTALLAQGTAMEYAEEDEQLSRNTMDQFNAFVEAAEAVEASTAMYNEPLGDYASSEAHGPHTQDAEDPNKNMTSCIENGCSKGFGGKCNCKAGCTCCARARAAERSANRDGIHAASSLPSSSSAASSSLSSSSPTPPSFLLLSRLSVRVHVRHAIPTAILRAVLKATTGVRSVHPDPTQSPNQDDAETHHAFVLRCDPGFDARALESLTTLGLEYAVEDQSSIDWSFKEIVLRVEDMMCPGNCGRTVMNAMQQVGTVHTANLVFEDRCVIARGDMGAPELCDAIESTGFDAVVVAETPLPKRFRLRVQDFASVHLLGTRLRDLLVDVEGVESVVIMVDRAEVLVEATLNDAGRLLEAANANRIMMVEVPEDGVTLSSPFDPATETKASSTDGEHVCDVKVCPHNGCEQYMVTVAHTAALAVGWAVPGCAMSWGGECTCGESCKCKGCPQHNPLS